MGAGRLGLHVDLHDLPLACGAPVRLDQGVSDRPAVQTFGHVCVIQGVGEPFWNHQPFALAAVTHRPLQLFWPGAGSHRTKNR